MAKPHRVCKLADLPPGQRTIVELGGRSIGVFNVGGELHALRNACPHQNAPLCQGRLSGTTLPGRVGEFNYGHDGYILRCPWHGWEFDIRTGGSVFNPHKVRVKNYQVTVEGEGGQPATCTLSATDEDPSVETYPVTVESQWIVVHV